MHDMFEVNKKRWNAITPLHLGPGECYDVEAFRKGASTLRALELELLGDVADQRILHAQCHIGVDSMSLARLGARVTGVDFAEEAIAAARMLNDECGLDCRFVCCNIYDLPLHLDEEFDIAYTSYGVLCWLPDLANWARTLARFLRPGGRLVLIDGHPLAECVQPGEGEAPPHFTRNYLAGPEPVFCPVADDWGDYHAHGAVVPYPAYECNHTMAEIINAVVGAGMIVELLGEYAEGYHQCNPAMAQGEDRLWRLPAEKALFPLVFSLTARRP